MRASQPPVRVPRALVPPGPVVAGLVVAGLVAGLLTGCGPASVAAPGPPAASAPAAAATDAVPRDQQAPAPPEPAFTGIPPGASPLSGRAHAADRPVLVVKLDNTSNARPHAGLRAADVVYLEEVEYGLTRIAAVFSSVLPQRVGPIRSARITDVDLLRQFGHPAFSYSGAQSRLRPVLAAAPFRDVSGDLGGTGYWRAADRRAPWNFFGDPARLLRRAADVGRVSVARDVGWVFSAEPPAGGRPVTRLVARWPASTVEFRWDPGTATYTVRFDGRPARAAEGGVQRASTVLVQYVRQTDSGYGDRYGGRTPLAQTVGTGRALVLRDGRAWPATWVRNRPEEGTHVLLSDGTRAPFAVGQQWVLLMNQETPVTVR